MPGISTSTSTVASRAPTTFDTFTLFPRLPIELRLAIWKLTAEPRNIQVLYNGHYRLKKVDIQNDDHTTLVPSILGVNQESCEVGKGMYEFFCCSATTQKSLYFNWDLDTLLASGWLNIVRLAALQDDVRKKIRHAKIEGKFGPATIVYIYCFSSLKSLVFDHYFGRPMTPCGLSGLTKEATEQELRDLIKKHSYERHHIIGGMPIVKLIFSE